MLCFALCQDGSTALMCACEHGHLNIAKRLLLEPHCDASIEDSVSYIQISHVTFSRRFLVLIVLRGSFLQPMAILDYNKISEAANRKSSALAPAIFFFRFCC